MSQPERALNRSLGLVDVVDHLLNRGVMLMGDSSLSLAGVDLVYLKLYVMLTSTAALQAKSEGPDPESPSLTGTLPLPITGTPKAALSRPAASPARASAAAPLALATMEEAPEATALAKAAQGEQPKVERGLAQLVLTLAELLRQVVERQALRRMETGGLSDEQMERMGLALRDLEAKMIELRALFGLEEDDLNLDLGPLGRVL